MTETQNLSIPHIQHSVDHLTTPTKRSHRHKRSFAISGDFEFLKAPPPSSTSNNITNGPTLIPPFETFISSEIDQMKHNTTTSSSPSIPNKLPDTDYSNLFTPKKKNDLIDSPNLSFFITQETKFSSPIKGVPDAIIDLDDALKSKPRSFKSHRRTESAPAGLEFIFDPFYIFDNNKNRYNDCSSSYVNNPIEEEEEEDIYEDNNSLNNNNDNNNANTNTYKYRQKFSQLNKDTRDQITNSEDSENIPNGLMSPMRPSSPLFQSISRDYNASPIKNNSNFELNDTYNAMRIKGQKQRYSHYTKQLTNTINTTNPLLGSTSYGNTLKVKSNSGYTTTTIQSHSLKEQPSMSSLCSNFSKTSLTPANTPHLQQTNTPSTPISYSEYKKPSFIESHTNNIANNNNTTNNIGNVSYRNLNKKSWIDQTRRQMSPNKFYRQQQQQTKGFSQSWNTRYFNNDNITKKPTTNGTQSSFNFETKAYYIEYNVDQKNKKPSNEAQDNILDNVYQTDSTYTNETNKLDEANKSTLSKDILLGEPGDVVDLSASSGQDQLSNNTSNIADNTRRTMTPLKDTEEETTDFDNPEIRVDERASSISKKIIDKNTANSNSTFDRNTPPTQPSKSVITKSKEVTTLNLDSHKPEIRSISDGIIQLNLNNTGNVQEKGYRKKKSRLSALLNNLFK